MIKGFLKGFMINQIKKAQESKDLSSYYKKRKCLFSNKKSHPF